MAKSRLVGALLCSLFLSACTPDDSDVSDAVQNPNFCALVGNYLPIYMSMSDTAKTRAAISRVNILHACKCLPKGQQPKVCS